MPLRPAPPVKGTAPGLRAAEYGFHFVTTILRTNLMISRRLVVVLFSVVIGLACLMTTEPVTATEPGYTHYVDPQQRYALDYPSTMKIRKPNPKEIEIFHPRATLRITVSVEKRQDKQPPNARLLIEALKKKLKEEQKNVTIVEQGKAPGMAGAQAYMICSFKDNRGMRFVQLIQYYVSKDRLLLMIISDRLQGFKNLETVIRKIHHSLKILNPKLK
jgi:hypothetical protein